MRLLQAHAGSTHPCDGSIVGCRIFSGMFFFSLEPKQIGASVVDPPAPVHRRVPTEGDPESLSPGTRTSSVCWKLFEPRVINSNQHVSHTSPGRALPTGANVHDHRPISLHQRRVHKHHSNLTFHFKVLHLLMGLAGPGSSPSFRLQQRH